MDFFIRIFVLIMVIVGVLGIFLFEETNPQLSSYIRMVTVALGTIGIIILSKSNW